jgi:signal transduction histidine kinase
MRPRPTIRLRLTALYALLVFLAGGLLLAVSYALLDRHLHDTLSDAAADGVLRDLRGQYVLALLAVTVMAVLLGWLIAGRALSRLRAIEAAASAVSGESLGRRVALQGPDDELRELANAFDAMLERLDAAFASQKRFVANASHELRTPLTVLRTEVEVALSDSDATAADLRATAEVVREEVMRFEALLESLLALARSEAGALESDEQVDLAETTRRVVERLRHDAAENAVRLSLHAERTMVAGDPDLLEQLVFNLVENAVTHNSRDGFAVVRLGPRGADALLEVTNSGPRVPDEELALLTEPFHRFDRRRPGRGAGVGLSIVRAVATAHGGRLGLAPRDEGGLVAEVVLPGLRDGRARPGLRGSARTRPAPGAPWTEPRAQRGGRRRRSRSR